MDERIQALLRESADAPRDVGIASDLERALGLYGRSPLESPGRKAVLASFARVVLEVERSIREYLLVAYPQCTGPLARWSPRYVTVKGVRESGWDRTDYAYARSMLVIDGDLYAEVDGVVWRYDEFGVGGSWTRLDWPALGDSNSRQVSQPRP